MTNFEAIVKNNPNYVKEVLACVMGVDEIERVLTGELKHDNDYSARDKREMDFLNAEYVQPVFVLDKIEKKYLSDVIRPFKHKVEYISKVVDWAHRCFIVIYLKTNGRQEQICLPHFSENSKMYKGMAFEKLYTLKELGL